MVMHVCRTINKIDMICHACTWLIISLYISVCASLFPSAREINAIHFENYNL